jgi:hypothetical protein
MSCYCLDQLPLITIANVEDWAALLKRRKLLLEWSAVLADIHVNAFEGSAIEARLRAVRDKILAVAEKSPFRPQPDRQRQVSFIE